MKIFFAGAESNIYSTLLKSHGVTRILQSAFYLGYKKQPNEHQFQDFLLDSGGFTARKKGTPIAIRDYIEFLNKYQVKLAFNLDTVDVAETLENQRLLVENTFAKIIPVYHYSDFTSAKHRGLLEKFAGDFDYISLGGTAEGKMSREMKREFFKYVFRTVKNKVKIHGLAVTSPILMAEFPFYSVDSTTWLSAGKFGTYFEYKNGGLVRHTSLRAQAKMGKREVSNVHQIAFGLEEFQRASIKAFLQFEKYAQKLWAQRGVKWDE